LLGFVAGAFVLRFDLWPAPLLHRWFMAARALKLSVSPPDPQGHYFYRRARDPRTGVLRHDRDRAFAGVTLFTSGHAAKALLVDMSGEVVHQWQAPFSTLWTDPPHIDGTPVEDALVAIHKAHLLPNGDLIVGYSAAGATPWGYGMAKLDQTSRVLWTYAGRVHHDLSVRADGTIYTLTHAVHAEPPPGLGHRLRQAWIEDYVVLLSPEGKELAKVGITEAFRRSRYAGLLGLVERNLEGDLWHTNAVEPVDEALAARLDGVEAGQALISLRQVDCLAIVDVDDGVVVWAVLGPWRAQHDPDILENGDLLLFDNSGHLGPGGPSRVLEIDPTTLAVTWQYAGSARDPFATSARGSQQRLPNGNTLITESLAGRILEVTRSGDVVWEYSTPFRATHDPALAGILHGAERFSRDELLFLDRPPQ
jgi:hypothetical protein